MGERDVLMIAFFFPPTHVVMVAGARALISGASFRPGRQGFRHGREGLRPGVEGYHSEFIANLVVDDPNGLYTDLVVQLRCNEALLDEVQYRGGALPDQPGVALGRGFGISTGNAAQDFRPQLEASPWFQNVSEVP
jgi:hypothetical protein